MKRILFVLSVILTVIFIFSTAAPAAALDADKFEEREVTAYFLSMDFSDTGTCVFTPDLPEVPYIDIKDYFGAIFPSYLFEKNGDGTYTLTGENGKMIINAEADTVLIEEFEYFWYGTYIYNNEYHTVDDDNLTFRDNIEDCLPNVEHIDYVYTFEGYEKTPAPLYLNLSAYNIDIIEMNDSVYFPVSVINDILSYRNLAAIYLDGYLYFTNVQSSTDYFSRESFYNCLERSEALAEFIYNELCFQFDYFYGCPSSAPLAKSIEEMGFDKALDTYSDETRLAKQLLQSTSAVDFNLGLYILSKPLFDGGHTTPYYNIAFNGVYYPESALRQIWDEKFYTSNETKWIEAYEAFMHTGVAVKVIDANIENTRNVCLSGYEPVLEWENLAKLYICGNTAIFSFDRCESKVIVPFVQSLDYAAGLGIKNFVIDVSVNTGGDIDVPAYMIAMITNKNTKSGICCEELTLKSTKNSVLFIKAADLNLDGKWDGLDREVKYDFDFAVLTSLYTYSAANQLAVSAKENGVMIIGEKSSGGTCTAGKIYTAASDAIGISSSHKFVKKNGDDMDGGAEVDVNLTKPYTGRYLPEAYQFEELKQLELSDYDGFYDYASLGRYIDEFYDKGDINGDGVKNNKDVKELFNRVSENSEYKAACDINSNGKVNNRDVTALFRIVNAA